MKILLVFEDLEIGGGQKYGVELANFLYQQDPQSVVIAYGSKEIFWNEVRSLFW